MDDSALVERAVGTRDVAAFSQLARLHQSKVRGLLLRLMRGNHAAADDLAQETFLEAWRGIASFRGESSFSTWLYRIAYSRFLMQARKRKPDEQLGDWQETTPSDESATQARIDLEPWQKITDQSYQGDLDKLIAYHLNSPDPTFHAEGDALHRLVLNVRELQAAVSGLQGSLWHQLGFLTTHADVGLARATLGDWVPSFALSFDGIAFALLFAMILWLLFHALWQSVAWAGGARYRRREPPPRPARIQPTFKP